MKINIYLLFIGVNILMAWFHNRLRLVAIKTNTTAINHTFWAVLYTVLCFLPVFWFSVWLSISVLFLHLSVFPVAYNAFAGLPSFHLSKTTDSAIDKLMARIGLKSTLIVNIAAQLISLLTLYKSL